MRYQPLNLGRWMLWSTAALVFIAAPHAFTGGFALTMMTQMASTNTLLQTLVPDRLRGRVMAVYSMMFMGMAPLGALLAGTLAENLGAPFAVALGGVVCLAAAGLFAKRLPTMRDRGRQLIVASEMAGGEPAEVATLSVTASPDAGSS